MRPLQAHCHRSLGTLYAANSQREQARVELAAAIDLYRADGISTGYAIFSTCIFHWRQAGVCMIILWLRRLSYWRQDRVGQSLSSINLNCGIGSVRRDHDSRT